MVVTQGSRLSVPVKRYVYRGTGIDTLTPDFETDIERAARERREAKVRERERVKREKRAAERAKHQAAERKRRADARAAEQARRQANAAKADAKWAAERRAVLRPSTGVRPSPGWKPTTGADIDAMLAEMEE